MQVQRGFGWTVASSRSTQSLGSYRSVVEVHERDLRHKQGFEIHAWKTTRINLQLEPANESRPGQRVVTLWPAT